MIPSIDPAAHDLVLRAQRHPRVERVPPPIVAMILGLAAFTPLVAAAQDPAAADHVMHAEAQPLPIHGFADVTFAASRASSDGTIERTNQASLGQLDLYMTSRLARGVSYFGEIVVESDETGATIVDLERLFLKYTIADFFRLSVGRTHTALGYWNEAFHHGALLQPSAGRPMVLEFEDGGGILPVHAMGLEASGAFGLGRGWDVSWVGNLANGRGAIPDAIQTSADDNGQKALSLKVTLGWEGAASLHIGPMVYHDLIPANHEVGRDGPMDELISGAHLHARLPRAELVAEFFDVRHDERDADAVHRSWGAYAIVQFRAGRVLPYVGYDELSVSASDSFFEGVLGNRRVLGGVRFDLSPANALKFELRRDKREGGTASGYVVQTAFSF